MSYSETVLSEEGVSYIAVAMIYLSAMLLLW